MGNVNQGHWLRNYKRKCSFENCVFYFLKFEKVLLLMLTLFFLSILDCLTSVPEAPVNTTLKKLSYFCKEKINYE